MQHRFWAKPGFCSETNRTRLTRLTAVLFLSCTGPSVWAADNQAQTTIRSSSGGAFQHQSSAAQVRRDKAVADVVKEAKQKRDLHAKFHRNADGSILFSSRLNSGFGPEVKGKISPPRYAVRLDDVVGKDHNGNPVTRRQYEDRTIMHRSVGDLIRNGTYKVRPDRPSMKEQWEQKNRETRERIEREGPITTKVFIHPGTTPEESAKINDPRTGLRINADGSRSYVVPFEMQENSETLTVTESGRGQTQQSATVDTPKAERSSPAKSNTPRYIFTRSLKAAEEADLTNYFSDLESLMKDDGSQTRTKQAPGKPVSFHRLLESLIPAARAGELIELNPHAKDYVSDVEQMKEQADNLKEQVKKHVEDGANPFEAAAQTVDSMLELRFAESIESAAGVTKNLDYAAIQQAADELVDSLNSASSRDGIYDQLVGILDTHPEILKAMPDAYEKLDELFGKNKETAGAIIKPQTVTYIFVSESMGQNRLVNLFKQHASRGDVTFVLRGVPQGQTMAQGVSAIQKLVAGLDPAPNVVLDPTLFEVFDVTRVPTTVIAEPASAIVEFGSGKPSRGKPKLIAKAAGLADDVWIKEQRQQGVHGDLGERGETLSIAEPDMVELMKKRVAAIDWEAKKKAAVENFWKNKTFDTLPTAEVDRTRTVDLTITVPNDIRDLAGNLIRRAGERINPLSIRPFTQTMLIFNAANRVEVDRVADFLKEWKASGQAMPVLIATAVDKTRGWDGYKEITDRFDAHLNILTPEIKERWAIARTPSFVWADNDKKVFYVREIAASDASRIVPKAEVLPSQDQ